MKKPDNIEVRHLFPELYSALIELLQDLSADEWNYSTSSSKWTVKDIVAHLLDTDLRRISFQRDNLIPPTYGKQIENDKQLLEYINYLNNTWVEVSKRISPGVLIDLLGYIKIEMPKLLNSLNMNDEALFGVSWAGKLNQNAGLILPENTQRNGITNNKLEKLLANHFLSDEKWMCPLPIDTYVRGLPYLYQKVLPDITNTIVLLIVEDISNRKWILEKKNSWKLFVGDTLDYSSKIVMNADTAWRMFEKNISKEEAKQRITVEGNVELGQAMLELTTNIK